jgi:preprotein translocase subunit SecG
MEILVTIFHVLVCVLLVLVVLLQSGKGGGLASAIGGGLSSSSVLGGRSAATFLSRATTILATAFMLSCLVQSIAFQTSEPVPTTATERVMQEGGLPPVSPAPLGEGSGLLGEEPAAEGAAAGAAQEQTE